MHGRRSSWGVKVQYMQLAPKTSSCKILIAVDLLKVQRFYLDSQVQAGLSVSIIVVHSLCTILSLNLSLCSI